MYFFKKHSLKLARNCSASIKSNTLLNKIPVFTILFPGSGKTYTQRKFIETNKYISSEIFFLIFHCFLRKDMQQTIKNFHRRTHDARPRKPLERCTAQVQHFTKHGISQRQKRICFCVAVRTNLFSPCNYYAFESVAVRFFKCRIYTTPFLRQHSMQYIQNDPLHLGHMRCRGLFCDRISDLKN